MREALIICAAILTLIEASAEEFSKLRIYESLTNCWDGVLDLPNPGRLHVTLKVLLNSEGNLIEEPALLEPHTIPENDQDMIIAWDRAIRAVRTCQPYDMEELPRGRDDQPYPVIITFGHPSNRASS